MTITGLTQENLDWMRDALSEWEFDRKEEEMKEYKKTVIYMLLKIMLVFVLQIFIFIFFHTETIIVLVSMICGLFYSLSSIFNKIEDRRFLGMSYCSPWATAYQEFEALSTFYNFSSNKTIMGTSVYFVHNDPIHQCFVETKLPGSKGTEFFRKGLDDAQVEFSIYKDSYGLPRYKYTVYKPYDDVEKHY